MTHSPIQLFHAALRELPAGQVVTAVAPVTYYPEVVSLLEGQRPAGLPSRSVCVFASDSPVAVTRFLLGQSVRLEDINLYEVTMDVYHEAPFRLIHELSKRIKTKSPVQKLIDEYWQPQKQWVFLEYFGPSFTVIGPAKPVSQIELLAFQIKYEVDIDLSATL
jgi:hypothetical protein